jgi:bile acid:Na+ symporter, BASS family
MSLDRAINILVTITLIEMMVLVGLRVRFAELAQTAGNWRLVARAAMANYVLVPAVTVALLMLFHAGAMVAAGFLVLAVCPVLLTARRLRQSRAPMCRSQSA